MRDKIKNIMDKAYEEGRKNLTEVEVYEIFKILGLELPLYVYSDKKDFQKDSFYKKITDTIKTDKVVLKMVSYTNLHKTDSGGVRIVVNNIDAIDNAVSDILKIKDADGILAMEFIKHSPFSLGEEILLGARNDEAFGPIITLGPGGTHTESFIKALKKNVSPTFIPVFLINEESDIEGFIEESWILNYCFGKVRGLKPLSDKKEIKNWISKLDLIMKYFNDNSSDYAIEEVEVNPLALSGGKFYALDGVLRFRKSKNIKRDLPSHSAIASIMEPKTVAVVGVSEKKINMARIILNNTVKAGFPLENICAIKEGVKEIDGVKAYPNISSVPFNIDMCVVAVPVENVMDVLEECKDSGKINGIVLITGGVGEKSGTESVAEKLSSIIKEARERNKSFGLNGGNCMGIVLNGSKVNTFFIPEYKMRYPLGLNPNMSKTAFISQSGAFVIATLTKIPHIIPDYTVTVGNQQDITVVDYLDYIVEKTDIKLILSYIEGFKPKDGLRLINLIKKAKKNGKIVVVYKAGRTSLGQKAVMGHTASIAGDYVVSENLISRAGAIVCDSFDEFCDMAFLSAYISKYEIKSLNSFFISNAGFETTGMADNISFLKANKPSESLKAKIDEVLKKYRLDGLVDFKNPMDITPMASDEAISEILENVSLSQDYSSILVSMVPLTPNMNTLPDSDKYPDKLDKSFLTKASRVMKEVSKPIIFCVASGSLYDPYVDYAINKGFVVFRNSDRMVRVYEKYLKSLI